MDHFHKAQHLYQVRNVRVITAVHEKSMLYTKTHIVLRDQATRHGCLSSLLGDGDKGMKIVYGEGKNIL
jgi:hypothetical protein